jgi:membrane-associated phospholipid phosphatase
MHVAFALMLGLSMAKIVRARALKGLWMLYPPLVTFVVLVTGNHYWFDAVLGAVVAAVSALAATALVKRSSERQLATSRVQQAQA